LALLALALVVVAYFGWRSSRIKPPPVVPEAGELVRRVAARFGCTPDRVTVERSEGPAGPLIVVTVHAPRSFPIDRFVLDLEAQAHNLGGRLEPGPLMEKGGYGLARLEGNVGAARCRVLVLGEEPPKGPAKRETTSGRPAGALAKLAIVLDDAGASLDVVKEMERLPLTVAVAVLPNAARSAEVARGLGAQGRELLLHMPMEPLGNHGPGPGEGAVEVGLPAQEIHSRVENALEVVRGVRGVNNHMGSRATADRAAMEAVMDALASRGLYFLDSRTTPDTVAEEAARRSGTPALHRDVFLDVVSEPEAIRHALEQAVARAQAQGSAVAIGHVHPLTIEILAHELARLGPDVRLVRPSQLLR
jgi:polysaccharide deacetylase 2 family uncharacterized protein YibQ